MLFTKCSQINCNYSTTKLFDREIIDFEEALVSKNCSYFEDFNVFTLISNDIDTLDRLVTRCLKPRTLEGERLEIMELIHNLGISSKLKQNEVLYRRCCSALWEIGKKYAPIFLVNNKQELEEPNIHLRLKTWDFIYRLCFIRGTATSGIFDCKEETFLELLNLIQFGNLLKVAEINDRPIPCSCVETSWKLIEVLNQDFSTVLSNILQTKSIPSSIDDSFATGAFEYVVRKVSPEVYIKVFYKLFPAFFRDYATAGRILLYLHCKISSSAAEVYKAIYENLIECFNENPIFIEHCEPLLRELTKRLNNVKDSITDNYFPSSYTSITETIEEYALHERMSDDQFQRFLRLFFKSSSDSKVCERSIPIFESYWGQVKVPKLYAFYLTLLAIAAKKLNPKVIFPQIFNLSGDDICPREITWLRFYIFQQCIDSEFKQIFTRLKEKMMASPTNFPYFIEAFSSAAATCAQRNPGDGALLLSLFSTQFIRSLTSTDIPNFLKAVHNLFPLPAVVFELFHKEFSIDTVFSAKFFAHQLSHSIITPADDKNFKQSFLTFDFVQNLVEASARRNSNVMPKNNAFAYQMALIFCFSPAFSHNSEGTATIAKFFSLISSSNTGSIQNAKHALEILDRALKSNVQMACKVYSKWIFEVIYQNVKNNSDYKTHACEMICEILTTESFKLAALSLLKSLKPTNDLPQTYIIQNFVEKYLIQTDLNDLDLHLQLLGKLIQKKLTSFFFEQNKAYGEKVEKNLRDKLENLEF